jgi:DNA-binding response OmpR family regulator
LTIEPNPSLAGSETVLLVEDEQAVRSLASRILSMNGYKVVEARNGEEALQRFKEISTSIHILVTDVVMLGMSGPELAKELSSTNAGLKVLFLSGYSENEMKTYFENGAEISFLPKPFRPRDLLAKIREVLNSSLP